MSFRYVKISASCSSNSYENCCWLQKLKLCDCYALSLKKEVWWIQKCGNKEDINTYRSNFLDSIIFLIISFESYTFTFKISFTVTWLLQTKWRSFQIIKSKGEKSCYCKSHWGKKTVRWAENCLLLNSVSRQSTCDTPKCNKKYSKHYKCWTTKLHSWNSSSCSFNTTFWDLYIIPAFSKTVFRLEQLQLNGLPGNMVLMVLNHHEVWH